TAMKRSSPVESRSKVFVPTFLHLIAMGLSSFVPAQLIAQSWCPPEARWGYDMGHPWGYASVDMVFCGGDTLVDGHQAIKMMRSSVTTQLMGNDTLITGTGLFRIMREGQGVV